MNSIAQLVPNFGRLKLGQGSSYSVGIDIGSRAMKFVQLQKSKSMWKIANRWTINYPGIATWSKGEILAGALDEIKPQLSLLHDLFRGHRAVVAMSMSSVDLCNFQLPESGVDELRMIVREELCNELNEVSENLQFDFWQSPDHVTDNPGNIRLTAVAAEKQFTVKIVNDLNEVGWETQLVDVIPCAIARAVQIVDDDLTPVAAIDFGYTSPIFTVSKSGEVIFTRRLTNCGLRNFLEPIQQEFNTTMDESQMLLSKYGIAISENSKGMCLARSPINTTLATPLEHLADELERTIGYYSRIYPKLVPKRCWMFGGGAMVKNLSRYLENRLRMPMRTWSLDYQFDFSEQGQVPANASQQPNEVNQSDALLGVAAGLSLLSAEDG